MEKVWEADQPVRVREMLEELQDERQLAMTTVLTVMQRLYRKGWLARDKQGKAHRYWATATRADYAAGLMDQAMAEGEDLHATLAVFVATLRPGELDELRKAVAATPERLPAAASF